MVFISCTKNLSRECAKVLRDWIKYVSNTDTPLLSSRTNDKVGYWLSDHSDDLIDIKTGIVCISKDNINSPWLVFELGALISRLGKNNVFTFLIDVDPEELEMPFSLVDSIRPNKEGMRKLLYALNFELGVKGLHKRILDQLFDACWPWFEENFNHKLTSFAVNLSERQKAASQNEDAEEAVYPRHSLGNRLKLMNLRNRQLQSEGNFSRLELVDRVSRMKLVDHIAFLIKKGFSPDEIVIELEGAAPSEYLMDVSSFIYENSIIPERERRGSGAFVE